MIKETEKSGRKEVKMPDASSTPTARFPDHIIYPGFRPFHYRIPGKFGQPTIEGRVFVPMKPDKGKTKSLNTSSHT